MLEINVHLLQFNRHNKCFLFLPDGWRPLELRGTKLYVIADSDNEPEEEEFARVFVDDGKNFQRVLGQSEGLYIGAANDAALIFLVLPLESEMRHSNMRDIELPKNFTTPQNFRG